jgi:hypothetical protein
VRLKCSHFFSRLNSKGCFFGRTFALLCNADSWAGLLYPVEMYMYILSHGDAKRL